MLTILIALSDRKISIQWITQLVSQVLIRWIVVYLVYSAIKLLNNRGQKFYPGAGKGPEGMEKARPTSVHQKLYTVSGCVTCQKSDKSFLGILLKAILAIRYQRFYNPIGILWGKNGYVKLLSHYPLAGSESNVCVPYSFYLGWQVFLFNDDLNQRK